MWIGVQWWGPERAGYSEISSRKDVGNQSFSCRARGLILDALPQCKNALYSTIYRQQVDSPRWPGNEGRERILKKFMIWAFVLGALSACSDRRAKVDELTASTSLATAANEVAEGREIDRAQLVAMPGLEAALVERAEWAKESARRQLRDPTDPIWGTIWTPDLITICGAVNGRNAFGAYAGDEVFYAPDGASARLPGHYQYEAKDLANCWVGGYYRVIIPAKAP